MKSGLSRRRSRRRTGEKLGLSGPAAGARPQALAGSIDEIAFEFDEAGTYLNVWTTTENLLTRPKAELIGHTIEELLGEEFARPLTGAFRRVLTTGVSETVEYPLAVAAGERRFLGRIHRIAGTAAAPGTVGMLVRDITEWRRASESEAMLVTAVEQTGETIMITDANAKIVYVNPAFEKVSGYSREEVIGQNPRILSSGAQSAEFYRQMWAVLGAGEAWKGQITNKRKDGALYEEDSTISPVFDTTGKVVNYVAVKRDVTEQKALEAQFHQAQKMESVGQLAGGIAHDFNNLLTVINGTIELVLEDLSADDPHHARLAEIQRAGGRAAVLTRQLLAFSRQQIMQRRVLSLSTVVADIEPMLRRLIGEDIDLVVALTEGPDTVKADPGQMEQVLANLVVNARDAMPDGGRLTIEIRHTQLDETYGEKHGYQVRPGPYVLLAVSDTGTGMDEATTRRVFEPFFTTKGMGKGTGLGLSTAYGIVKQNEGVIEVYSEIGRGATFKIYLPQAFEPAVSELPVPADAPAGGTETILLVEDEEGLRYLSQRILESVGYTVVAATNGEAALGLLERRESPVALVITDIVMPGMSGPRLMQECERVCPGLPVLLMSGYTDDVVVRHGVLDRGIPFLNKPFTALELRRKVREVLDSTRQR